jgi:hypothetical protein
MWHACRTGWPTRCRRRDAGESPQTPDNLEAAPVASTGEVSFRALYHKRRKLMESRIKVLGHPLHPMLYALVTFLCRHALAAALIYCRARFDINAQMRYGETTKGCKF